MLWAQVPEKLQENLGGGNNLGYIIGGAVAVIVLFVLYKVLTGGKKKPVKDSESGLSEDLADYPPPPAARGPRRLTVNGIPARVRLVIMAPAGKAQEVTAEQAAPLLEKVIPGISAVMASDKPRIRIWPAQMSLTGFTPKFQRWVTPPDSGDEADCWVLLSGAARVGPKPILIGLALLAEEPAYREPVEFSEEDWRRALRVEKV